MGWITSKIPNSETMSVSFQSLCPCGNSPLVGTKLMTHIPGPRIPTTFWMVMVILFCLMMALMICEFQLKSVMARCLLKHLSMRCRLGAGKVGESGLRMLFLALSLTHHVTLDQHGAVRPAHPLQMGNRTLGSLGYFCPVSVCSMCLM